MRSFVFILCLIFLLSGTVLMCTGCNRTEAVQVTLRGGEPLKNLSTSTREQPLRIGMGAMITPKEGYGYYQQLHEYIEKKLGRQVHLVDRESYDEMNQLMETGGVDAAFVCAGPYLEGKEKFGMELLAMPLVKGKPVYHSYIIVPKDSPAQRLEDLRGKVFAFADPKSNSGKIVPTYMLARMGETPRSFFSRYLFTYGHDKSIRAVAEGLVDGAAVDSLIWDYQAAKAPDVTGRTRIVAISEAYGIPPFVVRPGLDPVLKRRLRDILTGASADPDGKKILRGMMIDGFAPGDDRNYDSIRMINTWLGEQRTADK